MRANSTPDDNVHLVHRQGKFVVELFLGVDEVGVVVVQQRFPALCALCTGGFELGLLLLQLGFAGRQSGFPPGQLCLAGGLFFFGHSCVSCF